MRGREQIQPLHALASLAAAAAIGLPAPAASAATSAHERMVANIRYVEAVQEADAVEIAPHRAGRLMVLMGYDVARVDFSQPIERARTRTHIKLFLARGQRG